MGIIIFVFSHLLGFLIQLPFSLSLLIRRLIMHKLSRLTAIPRARTIKSTPTWRKPRLVADIRMGSLLVPLAKAAGGVVVFSVTWKCSIITLESIGNTSA
jgi:hypothetical protein